MPDDKTSRLSGWIAPLAIIGVLVLATILARDNARRTEVKNNLQQLSLALRHYESTFTAYLPDGDANEDGTGFRGQSYMMVLPYIDCAPLYNSINLGGQNQWTTVGTWSDQQGMWAFEGRRNLGGEVIAVRFISIRQPPPSIGRPLDDALQSLQAHPMLLRFEGGNYFSDDGLRFLSTFPQLEEVAIGGQRITDAGAGQLADFPALKMLTLDQTTITKHGLHELKRAPNLSKLTIIEPAFGDEGLAVLEQFPSLTEAELNWYFRPVKVTYAAMAKLLEAKPELKLQIRHDGSVLTNEGIRLLAAKKAP